MSLKMHLFPIEQSPGLILAKAHGQVRLSLTQVFTKNGFDITPSHWAVLSVLWDKDNIIQTDLARRAYTDRPNLTRMLTKLEKNGFIRRATNPNDQRSFIIQLTKKGKDAQLPLSALVEEHLQKAFKGVSQAEFDASLEVMLKIASNLSS